MYNHSKGSLIAITFPLYEPLVGNKHVPKSIEEKKEVSELIEDYKRDTKSWDEIGAIPQDDKILFYDDLIANLDSNTKSKLENLDCELLYQPGMAKHLRELGIEPITLWDIDLKIGRFIGERISTAEIDYRIDRETVRLFW